MFQSHYLLQQKVLGRWRYVSTVGLNETTIEKYIQQQEKHDIMQDKPGTRASLRGRWGGKGTGLEQSEGQHDSRRRPGSMLLSMKRHVLAC